MNPKPGSLTGDRSVVLPLSEKEILPQRRSEILPETRPETQAITSPRTGEDAWLDSMRSAFRSGKDLAEFLGLGSDRGGEQGGGESAAAVPAEPDSIENSLPDFGFPVFVPREFAARMKPGDPNDPLLRQVMPVSDEGAVVAGFDADPVGDWQANVAPGVLHKYEGRALVITTGACGVHCRYCFRRSFPYNEAGSRSDAYEPSIEYLKKRGDVEEVILSGGDPLTITDSALDALLTKIEAIEHVVRLRIHSRMPIVIPSRVNQFLIDRLQQSRLTAWMVVHCNHAAEIDEATSSALGRMVDAGIPVLNQSVLLRGVNDDLDSLESLSRSLMQCRVIPYYLHQLDRVAGAAHFEVPAERGRELIAGLESRLPGFAVPRYVVEIAGEKSKTRL